MQLGGRFWKSGKHWLVEVPALDAMTQGRTRSEAVRMLEDLVATMADEKGFEVEVRHERNGVLAIEAADARKLAKLVRPRPRDARRGGP